MNLVASSRRISTEFPTANVSVSCSTHGNTPKLVIVMATDIDGMRLVDNLVISEHDYLNASVAKMEVKLARKVSEFIANIHRTLNQAKGAKLC